jgi:threonine synthase
LFEMNDRDGGATAEQMNRFRQAGRMDVEPDQYARWIAPVFRAASCNDEGTLATMADVYRTTGIQIDPHTAVGVSAARQRREPGVPVITLATAHPAKFPDAVERATGRRPALPDHLADLFDRPERTTPLPNDLATIQAFVRSASRR